MDPNTAMNVALAILMAAMAIVTISLASAFIAARSKMRASLAMKELNTYFLLGFSSLLAKVAMADGSLSSIEEFSIEHMLHGMGLPHVEHAMCLGNFLLARNDARDAKSIASEFAAKMGSDSASLMYALLWRVASADGRIDNGENAVLEEIALAMHLPEHVRVGFRTGMVPNLDQISLVKAGVPQSLVKLVK